MVPADDACPSRSVQNDGLILGQLVSGKGIRIKIKKWDESPTVREVIRREKQEGVPLVHVLIMPEDVYMHGEDFAEKGFTLGDMVAYAERNMHDLSEEFVPGLPVSQSMRMYVITSQDAVVNCPHIGLIIGHSDLFKKYLVGETDHFIRPDIVAHDAREIARRAFARENND